MLIERKLALVRNRDSKKLSIKVGVGFPYRPARLKGCEDLAGCVVHTGLEDVGEREVFGVDELQALSTALSSVDAFLKALATQGQLFWDDGRQYDPSTENLFANDTSEIVGAILKKYANG